MRRATLVTVALGLAACPGPARHDSDARLDAPDGIDAADVASPDVASDVFHELPTLPPPDPCTQTALAAPRSFPPCGDGAGVFGRWIVDAFGLPAYEYVAAQEWDARASYPNTLGLDLRDHWHQIGNDRVTATAHNDGYVQLVHQERGVEYANFYEPALGNYAGGFGFVDDGTHAWCTAYAFRPEGAVTHRVFGMGYVEYVTEYDGVRVTRRTYAPPGDAPLLLTDVTLESTASTPRPIRYFEYWDVNHHQLTFELLRSGTFTRTGDAQRDAIDAMLQTTLSWDAASTTLRASQAFTGTAPPPDAVSEIDAYPPDLFLTALVGNVTDAYTDQARFFGAGGPSRPDAVASMRPGEVLPPANGRNQPAAFITRSDTTLTPGTPVHLRYAFGYVPTGTPLPIDPTWRDPNHDVLADTLAWWRSRLVYFASGTDPVLHRETAWHSYSIQSASAFADYFQTHTVAQGSAYLYSHGFDGAPRDQSLFALPLVYANPRLARELLTFVMAMTRSSDGSIAYSYHGHGVLEDAAIHAHPSDLDIYFLMALSEYVAATGDRAFLDAHVPFYPRDGSLPSTVHDDTVLDHARNAARHLFDTVGTGAHGLVRVLDGDWNDGIDLVLGLSARDATAMSGESHPNTAMAAFVLPLAADVLAPSDATLATEMHTRAQSLLAAIRSEWTGRWYPRAWLRDASNQPVRIGDDSNFLWLETQPWALLANAPDTTQRTMLLDAIDMRVDAPSPIGAMLQEPVPGNEGSAQVWPAVSGILTWAYTHDRPDLAWRSLLRNTFDAHANAYPEIWYGIWSGPDGVNGPRSTQAGYAWSSPATPMTDFPVMNTNPDALALLGVLRVAGIEPVGDGLHIRPVVPGRAFVLDTALVRLDVDPASHVAGEYRAQNDGTVVLHVALPSGATSVQVTVDGTSVTPTSTSDGVSFPIAFHSGDRVAFSVTFVP